MSDALLVPMLLKENVAIRTYDFEPLWRSSIGFDRIFDQINNTQLIEGQDNYPPYDIVRTGEETFRISLAVAGFSQEDITVTAQQNMLTIAGRKANQTSAQRVDDHDYLYQGISARAFERKFSLADHVEVESASLENGLLQIELARKIPEAMKPRKVEIGAGKESRKGDKARTVEQVRIAS